MELDKRYIITFFKKDSDTRIMKKVRVFKGLSENMALVRMSANENVPMIQVKESDRREGYKYIRELK